MADSFVSQPPLPLNPRRGTTEPRPAKGSRAKATRSIRAPADVDCAVLDLCHRKPERYPSATDVYVTGARDLIEKEALADGNEKALALVIRSRAADEFKRNQDAVLESIEETKTLIQEAVMRGMTERAHRLYADLQDSILKCGDADWEKEGIRISDTQLKPLLPKQPPLNLRLVSKLAIICDK